MIDKRKQLWLEREGTVLVVVDVQERLTPAMPPEVFTKAIRNIRILLDAMGILGLPVIITEQYPAGLGHTIPELAPAADAVLIEKTSFSCCGEKDFLAALKRLDAGQILLVGMESHVCVYQTLLDLLGQGYPVHLVRNAVCSQNKIDFLTALHNASLAGATITTVEMALFQMLRHSRGPEFKAISALIKNR
ncbi:MAG: hydrolase [Desulfuromonadaceae bacterium GWC2_58_13]|nr:MAG: hydrolase [Desulfuromonadaceae bacterium GWC2_58_13]